ncbi:class I SAM-dependent methyltransferase [Motiliproteus sediminis]|uniref:class I SAM-dependent methyltransferase n=1 Tax=Motiliproteus sediminis TaxID=1468178 RepID=UPI001AEF6D48|nr:class I SAM-dependent methyltransferase [Motiliproteus sediminis]
MSSPLTPPLQVVAATETEQSRARLLADQLQVPLLPVLTDLRQVEEGGVVLVVAADGLAAQETGRKAPGPVRVDFLGGAVAHRRQFGGGSGQQIAKAVGIRSGVRPRIADLTAGLGRDAFVLASLGCELTLCERAPVVALLLDDGLRRAADDPEVGEIVARMTFQPGSAHDWLRSRLGAPESSRPEVVYLDPMFPHSNKSAQVKKEMRLFRDLVGADEDAGELLPMALDVALARVVVKRPRKAPYLADHRPSHSLEGKSGRFDIYALKALQRSQ